MENYSNDISIKIKLTLEEMYSGVTKKFKYKRKKPCNVCNKPRGCTNCSGQGLRIEESIEEIKIPEGVDKGMVLKFKNRGHYFIEKKNFWNLFSNKNSHPNNNVGSLIINIEEVKHDYFSRDKADLIYKCQIRKSDLTKTDKKIEIKHLDDEIMTIQIPKNTIDGKIFRIKGKGFKSIADNQTGSLLIIAKIIED